MEDIIEKNWQYIYETATCRAIEIAQITGRWEIDDYRQEMFLCLINAIAKYDSKRSTPKTFVSLVLATAKKRIMRRQMRGKNQIISNAKQI